MDYLSKVYNKKYFNNLVQFENKYSMAVAIVLAVLAVVHIPLSLTTSKYITSTVGMVLLFVIAMSLLYQKSRLVMLIGLFAIYKLYHQARDTIGVLVNSVVQESVFRKMNTQQHKDALYDNAMYVPITLEEEIVGRVVPMLHTMPKPSNKIPGNFKPTLSDTYGATLVSDL